MLLYYFNLCISFICLATSNQLSFIIKKITTFIKILKRTSKQHNFLRKKFLLNLLYFKLNYQKFLGVEQQNKIYETNAIYDENEGDLNKIDPMKFHSAIYSGKNRVLSNI